MLDDKDLVHRQPYDFLVLKQHIDFASFVECGLQNYFNEFRKLKQSAKYWFGLVFPPIEDMRPRMCFTEHDSKVRFYQLGKLALTPRPGSGAGGEVCTTPLTHSPPPLAACAS